MDVQTDGGERFAGDRHRILREVSRELERHPIVIDARGDPPSTFAAVRATLAPDRWGHDVGEATLRVTWHPLDPPECTFHYSDEEFDCGWHHEPNPHVDGWAHHQERTTTGEYTYEPIALEGETATELVWEIMERLRERIGRRQP